MTDKVVSLFRDRLPPDELLTRFIGDDSVESIVIAVSSKDKSTHVYWSAQQTKDLAFAAIAVMDVVQQEMRGKDEN